MNESRDRWAAWLRLALQMGLSPRDFWRLSILEWRRLIDTPAPRLAHDELSALMMRFPDELR